MTPAKLVTLLEILKSHANIWAESGFFIGVMQNYMQANKNKPLDEPTALVFEAKLGQLRHHCEKSGLLVTIDAIDPVLKAATDKSLWNAAPILAIADRLKEIQSRLESELSHRVFLQVNPERVRYFNEPLRDWEEVTARFPSSLMDIEEMSKCFSLSRYAAAVFHSVNAIECGLIELGTFLGVADPKSGWSAVTRELEKIVVKTKYEDLPPLYQKHHSFLEQMRGLTEALKNSWRNKISHTQGRLVVMTADFSPDVAEEIMIASRSFMRRLATELPQ